VKASESLFPARSDWSDVNLVTRRVWIVREGVWANVVPLHPRRYARLIDALAEIASFPVSGYHAGAAQRIANEVLSGETVTKSADLPITEERPRDVGAPGAAT
jgi:hypothetical protein